MGTEKSADAFRTISEVADELQVPQHVLRFWEGRFAQVKPVKRAGGRRYYRPEDVELLTRIRDLLYKQGLTIKGVQAALKEGGAEMEDDSERPNFTGALSFDSDEEMQEDLPSPEPALTAPPPSVLNRSEPLLQPSLPGFGPAPASLPELPDSSRRELAEILKELEQLRVLLRP